MFIKKVDKTTLDVFVDLGWENWSRFDISGKAPKLIKGNPLSTENYSGVFQYAKTLRKAAANAG
jgi:hypothetical protein